MKSSNYQFLNISLFYPTFFSCILLTLTILGVTVNRCAAAKKKNDNPNYNAAVSTFRSCITSASLPNKSTIILVVIIISSIHTLIQDSMKHNIEDENVFKLNVTVHSLLLLFFFKPDQHFKDLNLFSSNFLRIFPNFPIFKIIFSEFLRLFFFLNLI